MTDKSVEEIKAKLKAASQAEAAKKAEKNQARARIAEKKREVAKLFNTKIGIFKHVIDNLNGEFGDTGYQLYYSAEDGSEWGQDLQRRIIAIRPLRTNDAGTDRLLVTFSEMGSVHMNFGTERLSSVREDQCTLDEFDANLLRKWIFEFIDHNVPDS